MRETLEAGMKRTMYDTDQAHGGKVKSTKEGERERKRERKKEKESESE
jgi:hypothetical protein